MKKGESIVGICLKNAGIRKEIELLMEPYGVGNGRPD